MCFFNVWINKHQRRKKRYVSYVDFSKGSQAAVSQCKPMGLASSPGGFLVQLKFLL